VDWDARDRFSRVASALFDALVLEPAGVTEQRLPDMFEAEPGHLHRIAVLPRPDQIPILINRAIALREILMTS
jgi:hypothetical protein